MTNEPTKGIEDRVSKLWYFAFGNGQPGADEMLRDHERRLHSMEALPKLLKGAVIAAGTTAAINLIMLLLFLGFGALFFRGGVNQASNQNVSMGAPVMLADEQAAERRGYYTSSDVAQILKMTDRTIREMCVDGRIRPAWKVSDQWRISLEFKITDGDARVTDAAGARGADVTRAEEN